MLYIPFIALCVFFLIVLVPRNCLIDGHQWKEFMFYKEKRRQCDHCFRTEFWDLSVSDVIEQYTGVPDMGQWSHIKYSPLYKKDKN